MLFGELTACNLFPLHLIFIAANLTIQAPPILPPFVYHPFHGDDNDDEDDDVDDDDDDVDNLTIQAPPILAFCLPPVSDCAASFQHQLTLCTSGRPGLLLITSRLLYSFS